MKIGGALPIPRERFTHRPLEGTAFVNARSAFASLVRALGGRVWLPSYLCGAMNVADAQWYDESPEARSGDIVLFVDYFGFRAPRAAMRAARARGAFVVEDACQAFLTTGVGEEADAIIYSPRKFVGVPDGGILVGGPEMAPLAPPPAAWLLDAVECRVSGSFATYQAVEANAPTGDFAMSELSRDLLENAFDYDAIARRRRENYLVLLDELHDIAFYPELPDGVVPIGFPIRVDDRDELRARLIAHQIYPAVHWPLAGIVPERFTRSHLLSSEILTLPCDQRYTPNDMRYVVTVVNGPRRVIPARDEASSTSPSVSARHWMQLPTGTR